MADTPLLVFGPRSLEYDFGPSHPLTPRRFGPGIDLLRAIGAEPGLAPEPALDDELLLSHTRRYVDIVRRVSIGEASWSEAAEAGIGPGDDPAFPGMHDAAAAVAGGSLRAIEAILRRGVGHAFHPGGGLHHAMPSRASGFCVYNDPALAIAHARRAGLRVLYIDLDVHHGDGVQAIHADDPGVVTVSFHESGRYLFPGTGFVNELGEGVAAGSVVNVPLEPETGEVVWLAAVSSLVPELAAGFVPDIVVSQHGADSHAWDPLAHLRNTTTAMGEAARLVDAVAHRWAGGRWLATGGGGYGVYRVVPRAWAHVWLAGAHREAPAVLPDAWRDRWAAEAARYGDRSLPDAFDDAPNAGEPMTGSQEAADARSLETAALVRRIAVPRLIREAVDRGWWSPLDVSAGTDVGLGRAAAAVGAARGREPTLLASVDAPAWARLSLAPRVVAPADPTEAHAIVAAGIAAGARVSVAVDGSTVVGLALSVPSDRGWELVALGVAPANRGRGLATELLRAHVADANGDGRRWTASVALAERDPIEPLNRTDRATIARRLLEGAGFQIRRAAGPVGHADPEALDAVRG